MSGREIAELTGKQHAHVMRDTRNMLEALGKDVSNFGSIFKDASKRSQEEFNLPKRETLILVSSRVLCCSLRVAYSVFRPARSSVFWISNPIFPNSSRSPPVLPHQLDHRFLLIDNHSIASNAAPFASASVAWVTVPCFVPTWIRKPGPLLMMRTR